MACHSAVATHGHRQRLRRPSHSQQRFRRQKLSFITVSHIAETSLLSCILNAIDQHYAISQPEVGPPLRPLFRGLRPRIPSHTSPNTQQSWESEQRTGPVRHTSDFVLAAQRASRLRPELFSSRSPHRVLPTFHRGLLPRVRQCTHPHPRACTNRCKIVPTITRRLALQLSDKSLLSIAPIITPSRVEAQSEHRFTTRTARSVRKKLQHGDLSLRPAHEASTSRLRRRSIVASHDHPSALLSCVLRT